MVKSSACLQCDCVIGETCPLSVTTGKATYVTISLPLDGCGTRMLVMNFHRQMVKSSVCSQCNRISGETCPSSFATGEAFFVNISLPLALKGCGTRMLVITIGIKNF